MTPLKGLPSFFNAENKCLIGYKSKTKTLPLEVRITVLSGSCLCLFWIPLEHLGLNLCSEIRNKALEYSTHLGIVWIA